LGDILAARTGLRSPEQFREKAAYLAAMLDHRAGREWRPLQDTATSVQSLFAAPPEWANWRRSADYYPEGFLVWLEVDNTIRRQTSGKKSLDDFCRLFYGGQSGQPTVVSYKFDDVVNALNQITPYNWAGLLRERINSKSPHSPLNGIENGGWKLTYTDSKNATMDAEEKTGDRVDLSFSLGVILNNEGEVLDAIPGFPAYLAGVGPGMKIIGVNSRKYSKDVIRTALRGSVSSSGPIELLVENADYYRSFKVDYHGGERYPHLVRNEPQADLLNEVIKPLAAQ
jgi:predicted metalloprotease with PDZ domain